MTVGLSDRTATKVFVTEATGFVGAHVVRALCARGDEVKITYRNPKRLSALGGLCVRRARADVFDSPLSTVAAGTQLLGRLGVLEPLKLGQRIAGHRVIAGV